MKFEWTFLGALWFCPLSLLLLLEAGMLVISEGRLRIQPKGKHTAHEEERRPYSLINNSVESLQLLEIKLQTGSFIPRRVQLIPRLDFKEAAVLLCGAAPRRPRPQLAAATNPIKSPPTGHTGHPGKRQLVFMEMPLIHPTIRRQHGKIPGRKKNQ